MTASFTVVEPHPFSEHEKSALWFTDGDGEKDVVLNV